MSAAGHEAGLSRDCREGQLRANSGHSFKDVLPFRSAELDVEQKMDIAKKVITKLPLEELWDEKEILDAQCVSKGVNASEITEMMQAGATFVVADLEVRPRWIDAAHRFEFWKTEVKSRLAEPDKPALLDRFPDEYCYFASKWQLADGRPLIVLERHH